MTRATAALPILLLVALPVLQGCAADAPAAAQARLAPLVGTPTVEVGQRLGPHARLVRSDGHAAQATVVYRVAWPVVLGPNGIYRAGERTEWVCDITVSSRDGWVSGVVLAGEACGWGGLPALVG